MNRKRIEAFVSIARQASPLPARFEDLDKSSQHHLTREAEARGLTPTAHYEALKVATAASDADDAIVAEVLAGRRI